MIIIVPLPPPSLQTFHTHTPTHPVPQQAGCNIEAINDDDMTCLGTAVARNNANAINALALLFDDLEARTRAINTLDDNGHTPLTRLLVSNRNNLGKCKDAALAAARLGAKDTLDKEVAGNLVFSTDLTDGQMEAMRKFWGDIQNECKDVK